MSCSRAALLLPLRKKREWSVVYFWTVTLVMMHTDLRAMKWQEFLHFHILHRRGTGSFVSCQVLWRQQFVSSKIIGDTLPVQKTRTGHVVMSFCLNVVHLFYLIHFVPHNLIYQCFIYRNCASPILFIIVTPLAVFLWNVASGKVFLRICIAVQLFCFAIFFWLTNTKTFWCLPAVCEFKKNWVEYCIFTVGLQTTTGNLTLFILLCFC